MAATAEPAAAGGVCILYDQSGCTIDSDQAIAYGAMLADYAVTLGTQVAGFAVPLAIALANAIVAYVQQQCGSGGCLDVVTSLASWCLSTCVTAAQEIVAIAVNLLGPIAQAAQLLLGVAAQWIAEIERELQGGGGRVSEAIALTLTLAGIAAGLVLTLVPGAVMIVQGLLDTVLGAVVGAVATAWGLAQGALGSVSYGLPTGPGTCGYVSAVGSTQHVCVPPTSTDPSEGDPGGNHDPPDDAANAEIATEQLGPIADKIALMLSSGDRTSSNGANGTHASGFARHQARVLPSRHHFPQDKKTYCGPAVMSMMVANRGRHTSWSGEPNSQALLAGDKYLKTDRHGGTRWGKGVMHKSLNLWIEGNQKGFYVPSHNPGARDLARFVTHDIDHGHPVALETYSRWNGNLRLAGHPRDRNLAHWTVGEGYSDWGDKVLYRDPVSGSAAVDWSAGVPSSSLFDTAQMASLMDKHGIVW